MQVLSTDRIQRVTFDSGVTYLRRSALGTAPDARMRLASRAVPVEHHPIRVVQNWGGGTSTFWHRWLVFKSLDDAVIFGNAARQDLRECQTCGEYTFNRDYCSDACRPRCYSCNGPLGDGAVTVDGQRWCAQCRTLYLTECSTPSCRNLLPLEGSGDDMRCTCCVQVEQARRQEAERQARRAAEAEQNRQRRHPITVIHPYSTEMEAVPCHVEGRTLSQPGIDWINDNLPVVGMELETIANGGNRSAVMTPLIQFDLTPSDAVEDKLFFGSEDGSLGSAGIEFKFQPMTPASFQSDWFKDLLRHFNHTSISWDSGKCGIHLSLPRNALNHGGWTRFVKFFVDNEDNMTWLAGRSLRVGYEPHATCYCNIGANINSMSHEPQLSTSHYAAINFCSSERVEVRIFRGTLKLERILAEVQFVSELVRYLRLHPTAPTWAEFIQSLTNRPAREFVEFCARHGRLADAPVEASPQALPPTPPPPQVEPTPPVEMNLNVSQRSAMREFLGGASQNDIAHRYGAAMARWCVENQPTYTALASAALERSA